MTTEERTKPVTDLFEQAMKNYEQALKTGLKFQEESSKLWAGMVNQTAAPQDWQKRMKAMADEIIPQTKKNMEESLKVIEHNSRTSIELLKKAVAAAQATSPTDAQAKFLSFWEASLGAMREGAAAVTEANNKAMETWVGFVRKAGDFAVPAAGGKS